MIEIDKFNIKRLKEVDGFNLQDTRNIKESKDYQFSKSSNKNGTNIKKNFRINSPSNREISLTKQKLKEMEKQS